MTYFLIGIFLLIILFLGNILINNSHYYFSLIYILLALYQIYFSILLIRKSIIKKFEIKNYVIQSFLIYVISYFLFCDPNPFFAFIFYYISCPNVLKAVIIIIIHVYFLRIYKTRHNEELLSEFEFKKIELNINRSYFISRRVELIKKKNLYKLYFISLAILIILNILFFENRTKILVHFLKKNKALPVSYSNNKIFYIASNLVNIENIAEIYIEEMKKLIEYLGNNNVIISIVENGDSVDNTRMHLEKFKNYLNTKKILNHFLLTREIEDIRKYKKPFVKGSRLRIEFYSKLRNKCFDYLYQLENINFDNTIIIYLNDVIFRYEDIINLLSTNNEDFDLVCGFDMKHHYFYDRWVSIDLDGNGLKKYFPYFINKEAQDLIMNHKPIRVFSCWNGVVAFKATPLKDRKLQFRNKINYKKPKYVLNNANQIYYESECTYFNIDLFSLGYTKKFINPDVRVVYHYDDYFKAKYYFPSMIHIAYSFVLYFMGFFKKRNKLMSDYSSKEIKLNIYFWIIVKFY